jgi:hypothetical protein
MPAALKQVVSVYLILVGLAVAIQFVIFPFYEEHDSDLIVWRTLDWFMAAGLLLALAGAFLRKRAFDASGDDPGWREYVEVNGLFYAVLALSLAFFPNWFAIEWSSNDALVNWTIWHVIDTALPILFVVLGLRAWREANA